MSVSAQAGQLWKCMKELGFNRVVSKVSLVSAGDGQCTAEMTVDEEHTNSHGTLHGGMTAVIVDVISTLALSTARKGATALSVDLNVRYLSAASLGEQIVIEAKTSKAGEKLAFIDVVVKRKSTGAIIATGSHIKYLDQ